MRRRVQALTILPAASLATYAVRVSRRAPYSAGRRACSAAGPRRPAAARTPAASPPEPPGTVRSRLLLPGDGRSGGIGGGAHTFGFCAQSLLPLKKTGREIRKYVIRPARRRAGVRTR